VRSSVRSALLLGILGSSCTETRPTLDLSPPAILSVTPEDGAVRVPLDGSVRICFDKPMRPESLSADSLRLSRAIGGQPRATEVTVQVAPDARCADLVPLARFSPSTVYRIEVTRSVLSISGVAAARGSGSSANAFTSIFTSRGPATRASLWLPAEGTTTAPTNLGPVAVAFSRPVRTTGPPLALQPQDPGESSLAGNGRVAFSAPPALPAPGLTLSVELSPSLRDLDGSEPEPAGALRFTLGRCAEEGPPGVGAGIVVARDADALLLFLTDRPALCDAALDQPDCPEAFSLAAPAHCEAPYDPCHPGGLPCQCQVPLLGLCPGEPARATARAKGWNGLLGAAAEATSFELARPLPHLVLNEIQLVPAGKRVEGAYLEVANLGTSPIDLLGLVLADCRGTQGCAAPKATQAFEPLLPGGTSTLAPRGYALLVDPHFQPSLVAGLPADALLLAPIGGAALLHLSTTVPQPIGLFLPSGGAALSTFDGALPVRPAFSLERIDPRAPDALPDNWAVGAAPGGTPGSCNSVTPDPTCAESP